MPTDTPLPTPVLPTATPTPALSTIEGRVCQDQDGDGRCQAEEPGIAGLLVTLDPEAGQGLQPQAERSTFTDLNGTYRFAEVEPGSHRLRFEDPTRSWLVAPVVVELSTELHQTATMDLGVAGPARRLYRMTADGEKLLHEWAETIERNVARLEEFLRAYRGRFGGSK